MASWLFAIGVSALAFAALTFLLRTETPKDVSAVKSKAKVFMLPVDGGELPAARAKIMSWLDLNSPDSFIKPDLRRGYSALCQDKPAPLQLADLPDGTFLTPPALPRSAASIPAPRKTSEDTVAGVYGAAPASLTPPPFAVPRPVVPAPIPGWVDSQGRGHGLDNGGRLAPGTATELQVEPAPRGLYPRVRVLASCGDKELDMLAARQICDEALKLDPGAWNAKARWRD